MDQRALPEHADPPPGGSSVRVAEDKISVRDQKIVHPRVHPYDRSERSGLELQVRPELPSGIRLELNKRMAVDVKLARG